MADMDEEDPQETMHLSGAGPAKPRRARKKIVVQSTILRTITMPRAYLLAAVPHSRGLAIRALSGRPNLPVRKPPRQSGQTYRDLPIDRAGAA